MLDECEQNDASCYGAPRVNHADRCCATCKDVKKAYQNMGWHLHVTNIIICAGKIISLHLVITPVSYINDVRCDIQYFLVLNYLRTTHVFDR